MENEIEIVKPEEIEKRSFEIISSELAKMKIVLPSDTESVVKRVIHATADFDFAKSLVFSENAVQKAREILKKGNAVIVTDTNMAKSGINARSLSILGAECVCFMGDTDVAREAKERGITRAAASAQKAARIFSDSPERVIFASGNAPTFLTELAHLHSEDIFSPAFVIGVPVGFVNVVQSKEILLSSNIPCIVSRGRKGGSTVSAAICNALLYDLTR